MPVGIARKRSLFSRQLRSGGCLALATLIFLLGSKNLQDAVADGDTRSISMRHTHTHEDISITFKRNGRYDDEALKKLNHFLRDWRVDESTRMDPRLFDLLWEVHREVSGREAIQVVSAFRSPNTNAMLRRRSRGVAQFSQHTVGHAMDFYIPGVPLAEIRAAGLRLQRGGVGFYPTSGSPFIHLDTGGVRHWPRMTRDQLARVFPDGKTVHIPSDGQPLPGYELALAEVERRGGAPSHMSLAAARNAGIATAEYERVGDRPKRGNVLARLFGLGGEEDDEAEATSRTSPRAAPTKAHSEIVLVPLPPARPARTGEFRLAAAASSPADIINSRGFWQGDGNLPSENPGGLALKQAIVDRDDAVARAVTPGGQRLAWISGPQGHMLGAEAPMPRPRRAIQVAAADTTASVNAWQADPARNDRVPSDLALAYAAKPDTELTERAASLAAPMGNRLNAVLPRKKPAAPVAFVTVGQRSDNPWLRGLIIAPSVETSLQVSVFGAPDHRALLGLMHKPRASVAMVFSRDPHLGVSARTFSGGAVAFLPTVTFLRTASLF